MDQNRTFHRLSQQCPREFTTNLPRQERHKLMAVTEEEEALLEMIRGKRAMTASNSFCPRLQDGPALEPAEPHVPPAPQRQRGLRRRDPGTLAVAARGRGRRHHRPAPLTAAVRGAARTRPRRTADSGGGQGRDDDAAARKVRLDVQRGVVARVGPPRLVPEPGAAPRPAPGRRGRPRPGDPAGDQPLTLKREPGVGAAACRRARRPASAPPSGAHGAARVGGDRDGRAAHRRRRRVVRRRRRPRRAARRTSAAPPPRGGRARSSMLDVLDAAREGESLTGGARGRGLAARRTRGPRRRRRRAGGAPRTRMMPVTRTTSAEARPPAYSRKKPPMLSVQLSSYRHPGGCCCCRSCARSAAA